MGDYLSPHQPTRPAPRSPAPAADIELPEQTLAPPSPRPWMQPLRPLEDFPHPRGELSQLRQLLSPLALPPYPARCSSSSSTRKCHRQNMFDEATARSAREIVALSSVVWWCVPNVQLQPAGTWSVLSAVARSSFSSASFSRNEFSL